MKKYTILLAIMMLMAYPQVSLAQSLVDRIVKEVVDRAVDEAKTSIWGSFLDSQAKSEVKSKAKQLSNYSVDKSNKAEAEKKLGQYDLKGQYGVVYDRLYGHVDKCFNSTHNVAFSAMGKGSVREAMLAQQDSIRKTQRIASLSDVFSKTTMDSLRVIKNHDKLEQSLLDDVNENHSLIGFFNNNPDLLRTYAQLSGTDLRDIPSELLYWGRTVKQFNALLPAKLTKDAIDPEMLTFVQKQRNTEIYSQGALVGSIVGNVVTCHNLDLANMMALPDMEYKLPNASFKTDNMGRVVEVEQTININQKSKSDWKPSIDTKVLRPLKASETLTLEQHPALLEYGASDCYLNMAYFEKNSNNRDMQKALKKQLKKLKKDGVNQTKLVSRIEYASDGLKCSKMTVTLGDNTPCVFKN